MSNRKFKAGDNVVIHFPDGGQSSAKIVNEVEDNVYLCYFCGKDGWTHGFYSGDQMVPFGDALFMVSENPLSSAVELTEAAD